MANVPEIEVKWLAISDLVIPPKLNQENRNRKDSDVWRKEKYRTKLLERTSLQIREESAQKRCCCPTAWKTSHQKRVNPWGKMKVTVISTVGKRVLTM